LKIGCGGTAEVEVKGGDVRKEGHIGLIFAHMLSAGIGKGVPWKTGHQAGTLMPSIHMAKNGNERAEGSSRHIECCSKFL
jgi:hypothetical protein